MQTGEVKSLQGLIAQPLTDDRAPLTSPVTLQVAFALAAGYRWLTSESFVDALETLPDGSQVRRVSWCFEGSLLLPWQGDEWAVREFAEHLVDDDWARRNPRHPVALLNRFYSPAARERASTRAEWLESAAQSSSCPRETERIVREAAENYRGYRWKIQAGLDGETEPHPIYKAPLTRHILIRRGERRAYIPINATPEERAETLRKYGMG